MEKLAKMQVKSENIELKSPQKQVKTVTFRKQRFSRYNDFFIPTHILRVPTDAHDFFASPRHIFGSLSILRPGKPCIAFVLMPEYVTVRHNVLMSL